MYSDMLRNLRPIWSVRRGSKIHRFLERATLCRCMACIQVRRASQTHFRKIISSCSTLQALSRCPLLPTMKVFLTSGTGYVGAAIAQRLLAEGHHVGKLHQV
jgi:hypothetical protein